MPPSPPPPPLPPQYLLRQLLEGKEFALALAPGFFCFYCHCGFLSALDELGLLGGVTHIAGSSAGALVGGFLAAGMKPKDMVASVLKIDRAAIWDVGLGLGLLKGEKLQRLLEQELPRRVQTFEACKIKLGVTTFDLQRLKTVTHTTGPLAEAMRASACFPGLFAPVPLGADGSLHIDGGVFDRAGLVGLTALPKSKIIVNVVFTPGPHALPPHLQGQGAVTLITVYLSGMPQVQPFSMTTAGPVAYRAAKEATLRALTHSCHVQRPSLDRWLFFVEAAAAAAGDVPEPAAVGAGAASAGAGAGAAADGGASAPASAAKSARGGVAKSSPKTKKTPSPRAAAAAARKR